MIAGDCAETSGSSATRTALALLVALPLLPYWKKAPVIEHAADSGYMVVVVAVPLAMLAAFV